jgi:hypothetical protein
MTPDKNTDISSSSNQADIQLLNSYILSQIEAGVPEYTIVDNLVNKGIEKSTAFEIVRQIEKHQSQPLGQADRKSGLKHLAWGFVLLIGGAAITFGTWSSAQSGGSYWVMWGAMLWGLIHVCIGLYTGITNAIDSVTRRKWILLALGIAGCILIGAILMINTISNPTELELPSEDYISVLDDETYWENEEASILLLSGTVVNTHNKWSIKDVQIMVEGKDDSGQVIKTLYVSLTPQTLNPGERGTYFSRLTFPYSCTNADPTLIWEWVPP